MTPTAPSSRPLRAHASLTAALALLACASGGFAQPLQKPDPPATPPVPQAPARPVPTPATDAAIEKYQDRLVREVRLVGLSKTDPQLVRNQLRVRDGQPLNPQAVRDDVQRLVRLSRFKEINAKVQAYSDNTVTLIYEFLETPIITDVQAVGNRQIPDSEIAPTISLLKGTPVDEFQLGAASNAIVRLYRDKGYYQASVTVDQAELDKTGIVLFRITEGEEAGVADIRFEGNKSFDPRQLEPAIKTTTSGLFDTAPVDNDQIGRDVTALIEFYRDHGYLDVRADSQIIFSPNGKEAIVKFLIDEGPVYTLRSVLFEVTAPKNEDGTPAAPPVYSREQIAGLIDIKAGDVYAVDKIRRSTETVRNAYSRMGYADVFVGRVEKRDPNQPLVDLVIQVREGKPFLTGLINIKGNDITQDKVILRELDIKPDRPLDTTSRRVGERTVTESQVRLEETRLFGPGTVKVTLQQPAPDDPTHRDVLVEVGETNTGALSFGVGVNSDLGLVGSLSLKQRNFDIADFPDSLGELAAGRAFRGAGQDFGIVLAPGTQSQNYTISLSDPSLFDTDYTGSAAAYYRTFNYNNEYDESIAGTTLGLGRRFGERWVGNMSLRFQNIDISNLTAGSPVDYYEVEGNNYITGLGFSLTRSTVDSRYHPTRGSRIVLGTEFVGALGGDYNFVKLNASHSVFFPIYESALGHKTIFSTKLDASWIPEGPDAAPTFERYYRGGTNFRGFQYRTVSPKGITEGTNVQGGDPVGGTWMFFAGAEVNQPVWKDIVSVVAFVDSGTVNDQIGFSQYRVSLGVGLRLNIQALGPVPIAFDFGFPVLKQYGDVEHVFSFSVDLPF